MTFFSLIIFFRCFESYAENENECPVCTPENRLVGHFFTLSFLRPLTFFRIYIAYLSVISKEFLVFRKVKNIKNELRGIVLYTLTLYPQLVCLLWLKYGLTLKSFYQKDQKWF